MNKFIILLLSTISIFFIIYNLFNNNNNSIKREYFNENKKEKDAYYLSIKNSAEIENINNNLKQFLNIKYLVQDLEHKVKLNDKGIQKLTNQLINYPKNK